ncbi:MAG: hypothetical protein IKN65_06005, partial [Clostridia bacterium]|nr:hypothetical protein [Clostridia bacterium]
MRKAGNVSIKNLVNNAETTTTTNPDGTTTTTTTINIPSVVNDVGDVETVIQTMISNDKILDENDVQTIVSTNLANYTTTSDLQNDYATKTLLTNTLDNYTSKDLLTQSLSDRPTFTTTDAITTTTTNHENRIKGLEDNFVSTTVFTEALGTKAASTHTHTMSDLSDYIGTDLTSIEEDVNELTEQILAIEESLDDKANSIHTHTLSDISDYVAPDLTPYATTSAMNTALSGKAAANHTHELDDVILTYEEEEETNGETSTITKTKTLSEVLDGKAEATHTHTLSEITNYTAPDLSNCAKTNVANTFTTNQTITNTNGDTTLTIGRGEIRYLANPNQFIIKPNTNPGYNDTVEFNSAETKIYNKLNSSSSNPSDAFGNTFK